MKIGLFIVIIITFAANIVCRNEILIISDLHIGSENFRHNDIHLKEFLTQLSHPSTNVHTLVLNGDILDLARFRIDEMPLLPTEILTSTNFHGINMIEYVNLLHNIIENNVTVVYVKGNHDVSLEQRHFNESGLSEVVLCEIYEGNNYIIQHGHLFDLYNNLRPDGGISKKSYGHLLTRFEYTVEMKAMETSDIPTIPSDRFREFSAMTPYHTHTGILDVILNYFNEIFERFDIFKIFCNYILPNPIFFEMVKNNDFLYKVGFNMKMNNNDILGLPLYKQYEDEIVFGGHPQFYNEKNTTLKELIQYLRNTIQIYFNHPNYDYTKIKNMFIGSSCGNFEHFIKQSSKKLFILAHTHDPILKIYKGEKLNNQVIYANSGTWTITERNNLGTILNGGIHEDFLGIVRIKTDDNDIKIANEVQLCQFRKVEKTIEVISSQKVDD